MRTAHVARQTKESSVDVKINLDGTGAIDIDTGVPLMSILTTLLKIPHLLLGKRYVKHWETNQEFVALVMPWSH